jgi:hypothetical protein
MLLEKQPGGLKDVDIIIDNQDFCAFSVHICTLGYCSANFVPFICPLNPITGFRPL